MNNIRRDEIEKIKRRRKRKSKFPNDKSVSRMCNAFSKHIEATRPSIENKRFSNAGNKDLFKLPHKLTMGIFDNAVCSKNVNKILRPLGVNEMLLMKPHAGNKVIKEGDVTVGDNNEDDIKKTISELSKQCNRQLKLNEPTNDSNAIMLNLMRLKAEAKRNNKLSILDNIRIVESEHDVSLTRAPACRGGASRQRIDEKMINHGSSLSASTSISNARMLYRPPILNVPRLRTSLDRPIRDSDTAHPLWDTPEELRTSCLTSFSDRSILDKTLSLMNESKFVQDDSWYHDRWA